MFKRILIANRGEIACRIIKTAERLGIATVAVYSDVDKDSLHVLQADQAFCIGTPNPVDSYLNIDKVIDVAKKSGAEAIHPGYGFLSENPNFVRACEHHGLVFIGPSAKSMELMASKQLAKQLLENTSVPLIPGYHGNHQSDDQLMQEAARIGFPVMIKAANGGGGKGMRAVYHSTEFMSALSAARRESMAYFGDETIILEKLFTHPRHIEVQIMADNFGDVVHLFERDCSIQRRNQKILEESPAPGLSEEVLRGLYQSAIEVARAIEYRGAGTIEFLLSQDQHYYFMEMNTRLQVEHPVTEMITNFDLVEWQLRIAANQPLPNKQTDIQRTGHAIECRIYAEDPARDFLPSVGQLDGMHEPVGPGVRVDSGIAETSVISQYYDSLLAKLIVWGDTREQAIQRLNQALMHYYIAGIYTNIAFLHSIVTHQCYQEAKLSTHFLNDFGPNPLIATEPYLYKRLALYFACSLDYLGVIPKEDGLIRDVFAWQNHLTSYWFFHYSFEDLDCTVKITFVSLDRFQLEWDGVTSQLQIKYSDQKLHIDDGNQQWQAWISNSLQRAPDDAEQLRFYTKLGVLTLQRRVWNSASNAWSNNQPLLAPMPSTVVAIVKKTGDIIKAGERLIVLEAMKMEYNINAPHDGVLEELFCSVGMQVNEGVELARIVAIDTGPS